MLRTSTLTIAVIVILAAASLILTVVCIINHPRPDWDNATFNGLESYPTFRAVGSDYFDEIDRPADLGPDESLILTYQAFKDGGYNGPKYGWYRNGELMYYSVDNRGQNGIPLYKDPLTQFYPNGLLLSYRRFYHDRNLKEDNFYDRDGHVAGSITTVNRKTSTYRWGGEVVDTKVFMSHLNDLYRDAGYGN